uniref:Uncharacterized protein n=1 Tax=Cairina moschata TaxID=8855 RepID=A0A8C3BT82_CAIMO
MVYWSLSVLGSAGGLGGRAGWLRASSVSHCTSTREPKLEPHPAARCPQLTWIFLCSRCLARLLSEALALRGSPAFWFSSGIRLVSRVLSLGWKYFRAWKSLWMACPTTILSFKIFRIWKRHGRGLVLLCNSTPPITLPLPFLPTHRDHAPSPNPFFGPCRTPPWLTSAWAALKGMAFLRCPLVTPLQRVR